ncbi:dTDP-glucose 4,6-dehydratase [Candidatus Pacearchaeota archaeon]|nr:dTDP-glucose 4,6-dehydratase [Candidatus Pacearchaeota archaeon]
MTSILVTGGAGFIGSNFIRYFLHKYDDIEIINFDKLTYCGNLKNLSDIEDRDNYKFIKGDISNYNIINKVMKKVDAVIHFAAETHVDNSITDPFTFIKTNVLGTQVLLNAALKNNLKLFYHISTDEVFGELGETEKFSETTPYRPRSPYSASKAASDHLVRAYYETYDLPIIISNCSNNYGPYQYPEKIIPLFITNLIEGKKVPLYGDGKNVRDWLHVVDHCKAIDFIFNKGKIGETYCIGGDCELSNIELTKIILKNMGYNENMIKFVPDRKGHDFRYAMDFSKITNELGWKPKYKFKSGIKNTIKWYKKNISWWKELKKT